MRRLVALALLPAIAACSTVPQAPQRPAVVPLPPLPSVRSADLLRVRKAARSLEIWSGGRQIGQIAGIQLGWQPVGPKQFEGDGKTPEGRYTIDWRNPHSAFHLSLHVSYPDARDIAAAREQGRDAGGMIMIHGQPNGSDTRRTGDWTDGCIALSDAQIEALWDIVPDGTAIEILP